MGLRSVEIEPRSVEISLGYFSTAVKAYSHYSPEHLGVLRACQPNLSIIRIPCLHPYTSDTLQTFSCGFLSQESRLAMLEDHA